MRLLRRLSARAHPVSAGRGPPHDSWARRLDRFDKGRIGTTLNLGAGLARRPSFLGTCPGAMSRYLRSREGTTFFFTVVTHLRRPILTTDLGRAALREALREARRARPFSIVAIVLLPDHLHAVWEQPRGDVDFSTRWRHVKAHFTRLWHRGGVASLGVSPSRRRHGERGVWQRRFHEHTCRDESDLKRCVDYVHVNPLKHRLVGRVVDWPWSSFHRHVRAGEYPRDWGASSHWHGDEFRHAE